MDTNNKMSLKDVKIGERVEIVGFANQDKEYRQKLFSLGLMRGEYLRVTKKAPLGDPIEVCLNGSKVSLRKEEATELVVELDNRHHCHGQHKNHGGHHECKRKGFGRFFNK